MASSFFRGVGQRVDHRCSFVLTYPILQPIATARFLRVLAARKSHAANTLTVTTAGGSDGESPACSQNDM
jgi:hypothetical protein